MAPKAVQKILWLVLLIFVFSGCATIPPSGVSLPQMPGISHIVGSGQTLYRISKAYGVDMHELMRINNIKDPNQIGVGDRLFIPGATVLREVKPYVPSPLEPLEGVVGRRQGKVKWSYITLHHSATLEGNAEAFDRNHRHRRMGGLFYHFVIGNGTASQDGEIEVGWRWRRQVEANRRADIQVCLVGDFNKQAISQPQFASLVKLIDFLVKQYSIPLCNIRRHKDIEGKATECPGSNFPLYKILGQVHKEYNR